MSERVRGGNARYAALVKPQSVADVVAAVRRAGAEGRSLYPVSTGRNWGYGGRDAVVPGGVLLDLSGMREIRNAAEISRTNPVAVIEPGVTQGQLHEFLAANSPDLMFNVTGSARETSIIGNALDRGVGYMGPRRDDLFALEVVTGTGDVIKTGFRRLGDQSPLSTCHPYGLGPMLDGLFFQGNFGIVTSACFKLMPRPPCQVGVSVSLGDVANLAKFIDVLAALKRERVMGSVTHIGNMERTRSSLLYGISSYLSEACGMSAEQVAAEARRALEVVAPFEWTSLGGVWGTPAQVRAAIAEVKSRLRGIGKVMVIRESQLNLAFGILHRLRFLPWARANAAAISAIRPLNGLAAGIPTNAAVDNLLWQYGGLNLGADNFEESRCGIIYTSPALPMDGGFVVDVVGGMRRISLAHGFDFYVTINIETDSSLVAISNILFDKSDMAEAERARTCALQLHAYIKSRGLEVYRARTDMMGEVAVAGEPYWELLRGLKQTLDPANVIAPQRYNLPL